MIRLLKFLFTGSWHMHEWEEYQQIELVNKIRRSQKTIEDTYTPSGLVYIQRCKKCGTLKEWRFW